MLPCVGLNWQHLCILFLVILINLYIGIEVMSFTVVVTAQVFTAPVKITIITSIVRQNKKCILHSWKIKK